MKPILLVLSFLMTLQLAAFGGNPVGLVCTYDYRTTLQQDDVNVFDSSKPVDLSYVVTTSGEDSLTFRPFTSLERMIQTYAKSKNLLVYVHGDHSILSDLLANASVFADTYKSDLLMFIWPSNSIENRSIKNYKQSKSNSMAVLPNFASIVDSISMYCKKYDINCTLMFHSLGNLFAKNFVRFSMAENRADTLAINNVLLNAACVWENDHDIWVDLLSKRIQGKVFITQNRSDQILSLASEFIEFGDLLGMTAPQTGSRSAIYVDFTDVLKRRADIYESHGYYFGPIIEELPQIQTFYQHVFDADDFSFLNDKRLVVKGGESNSYVVVSSKSK